MKRISFSIFLILPLIVWAQKSQTDGRYLSLTQTWVLNTNGTVDYKYEHSLKYLTYDAFHDLYGEDFIVYNPSFQKLKIEKSVTTMKDGKRVASPSNAYNEVLPHMAVGSGYFSGLREMIVTHTALECDAVVDFAYTLSSDLNGLPFGKRIVLPKQEPVDNYKIIVKVPVGVELQYRMSELRLAPQITKEKDFNVYTWNIGSMKEAPLDRWTPEGGQWLPTLWFGTSPNLYRLTEWLTNQEAFKAKLDNPDLKRRIVDLVKDCPNTESKVFAIRDYLNNHVNTMEVTPDLQGYKFRTPSIIWNDANGTQAEKSLLLCAALNDLEINAQIVGVVSEKEQSTVASSLDQFSRFLLRVNVNQDDALYLDACGQVNGNLMYRFPGSWFVLLDPAAENLRKWDAGNYLGTFKGTGSLRIDEQQTVSGMISVKSMFSLNLFPLASSDTKALAKLFSSTLPVSAITDTKVTKNFIRETTGEVNIKWDKALTEIATNELSFTIPQSVASITNWSLLPWLNQERSTPVNLTSPFSEYIELKIELPEGYSLKNTRSVKIEKDFGSMIISFVQQGNTVTIKRGMEILPVVILSSSYQDFRDMLVQYSLPDNMRLVLQKK
jgi:hypothetical protein